LALALALALVGLGGLLGWGVLLALRTLARAAFRAACAARDAVEDRRTARRYRARYQRLAAQGRRVRLPVGDCADDDLPVGVPMPATATD
jgi:hypothetical protein